VALTFDDGPDPRWTPKILDILKAKHAPATFFVIGENMQNRPRPGEARGAPRATTWAATPGPTPTSAKSRPPRRDLELNATQRLFEVITGRSMRLFRPPYFGDAEPSTPREVEPLLVAQALGYLAVGLRIDPDDWKKPTPQIVIAHPRPPGRSRRPAGPGGAAARRGGDRAAPCKALPELIDPSAPTATGW
jgi:peptidoglycan/xylan/chitin deacetylase (PgdA/CDA1 family)